MSDARVQVAPGDAAASAAGWLSRLGDERFRSRLAIVLLFMATVPMLTKIFTSDFGTHIAKGREIVRTLAIPDKEFLNYPRLGQSTDNMEWGFQTVLYLVHSAGGEYGVSFFIWLIVCAIYFLLYRSMRLRGADPVLAVFAVFAFSGFLRIRLQPRPELFTYLFIAATIFLHCEYYFGRRKKLIYLFPPMLVLWANSHPTYLMAFILSGAFFADAVARAAWNRELAWEKLKQWAFVPLAAGAAALVLCGFNPYGYDAILAPLHLISRGGGASQMLMSISELTPTKGTGMYVYWKAAAVFAAVSLVLGAIGGRVYLLDLLLFAIAFKGAYDAARAVSMMGLFISPGAALHLTGFVGKVSERLRRVTGPNPRSAAGRREPKGKRSEGKLRPKEAAVVHGAASPVPARLSAVIAAVVIALVGFGGTTLAFSMSQLEYGVGMTSHKFSFAAAEFLRKNPVPGKMFNFFDIGGFLDWQLYPEALTFIDGRTNSGELFMEHQIVTGGMPGWQSIVEKYGITHMVLKGMDSSGMILPIISVLANDPGWSLVFSDGLFVIFVKNSPDNAAYIQRHELPKSALLRHLVWEAYHYMYLGVSPVVAYQTMSNMYRLMGDIPSAAQALRMALKEQDLPFLREQLMRLEQAGGGLPPGGSRHP